MPDAPAPIFTCKTCGKRFQWTPALAGRRIRCNCGAMLKFPQTIAARSSPAAGPSPTASSPAAASAASQANSADLNTEKLTNLHAPLALLAGGLLVQAAAAWFTGAAVAPLLAEITFRAALMLPALWIAGRVREIKLGPLPIAALKTAAISVAPAAVILFFHSILSFIPFGLGGLVGLVGAFVIYFALIGFLFDLDESDTWYCLRILFIIHIAVYFFFQWILHRGGN